MDTKGRCASDIASKSSHNRGVIAYVGWFIVTLALAAGVLVAAAALSGERPGAGRGLAGFWADIQAGFRAIGRGPSAESSDRGARAAAASNDTAYDDDSFTPGPLERFGVVHDLDDAHEVSLASFFVGSEEAGDAYVQADDITATLERARAAVRTKHLQHAAQFRAGGQPRTIARVAGRSAGHVPASRRPKNPRKQASA